MDEVEADLGEGSLAEDDEQARLAACSIAHNHKLSLQGTKNGGEEHVSECTL